MRRVVARIGRAHGIHGEVTVEVRTDVPDERFVPGAVLAVTDREAADVVGSPTVTLERVRDHNGTLLLTFEQVRDRAAAEALHHRYLAVDVPDASSEPDAWYDHELVGLRVLDPSGRPLGEVVGIDHPGAQDLLHVRVGAAGVRLVPFVHALVPVVDVQAGHLVVDAPPGLLDDEPGDRAAGVGVPAEGGPAREGRA
jgi:16S rRNA processing protein RimM